MISERLNLAVGVLLSVVLAIALIAPPALQHSHAEGNVPHDHDSIVSEDHDHDHDSGLAHCHSDAADDSAQVNGSTTHRHCYLLGWEITVPTSDEVPAQAPIEHKQQVLSAGVNSPLAVDTQYPSPLNGWVSDLSFILAPTAFVCRVAKQAETATPRVCLCDFARHERSGVQLI